MTQSSTDADAAANVINHTNVIQTTLDITTTSTLTSPFHPPTATNLPDGAHPLHPLPILPPTHTQMSSSSSNSHMILAGLISGVTTAGLFNPYDRALYLSVLHSRPFLTPSNFLHPYQGFLQVVVHRTLSGGLYFPLFDMAQPIAKNLMTRWVASRHLSYQPTAAEQSALLHFACGNFAGGTSGILLNSLTAIKYHSWDARTSFFQTARNMYKAGGYRPFVKGVSATVIRDTIFGGVFAWSKFHLVRAFRPHVKPDSAMIGVSKTTAAALQYTTMATNRLQTTTAPPPKIMFSAATMDFSAALLAGLLATTISAPFNYIRNIKYGWPSHEQPPSGTKILVQLWADAQSSHRMPSFLQERLRLGWGTARVALGMSVGQFVYERSKTYLDDAFPPRIRQKQTHQA